MIASALAAVAGGGGGGGGTSTASNSGASGELKSSNTNTITQGNITFGAKPPDWTMLAFIGAAALMGFFVFGRRKN